MDIFKSRNKFIENDYFKSKYEQTNYKMLKHNLINQNRLLRNMSQDLKNKSSNSIFSKKKSNINTHKSKITDEYFNYKNKVQEIKNSNKFSKTNNNGFINKDNIFNSLFYKNNSSTTKKDHLLLKQEIIKLSFKNKKLKYKLDEKDKKIKELQNIIKSHKIKF